MDLELLKRFYAAAQEGQIGRAAQRIYVAQSALTRSIQLFEHQMKNKLFTRSTKGAQLTPQGERLYEFAKKIMDQTTTFEKIFHEKDDDISGDIKIITMPFGGSKWLVPSLKGFLDQHPNINIKISLNSEDIDLTEGDVLISPFFPHQPHLIQKHIYTAHTKLFASQDYLDKFGVPQTTEDLDHHRLVVYKSSYYTPYGNTDWILNVGIKKEEATRKPYFEIDSLDGILASILEGYGIGQLPDLSVFSTERLKQVLPETRGPSVKMYYVFPEKRKGSKKINALLDHLSKNIDQWGTKQL